MESYHLPKVSCSKPDRTVAEITRKTKSDPFGNSGEREIGEKVSNLSNIPSQTAQTSVKKTVESRTEVPSEDRLGYRSDRNRISFKALHTGEVEYAKSLERNTRYQGMQPR